MFEHSRVSFNKELNQEHIGYNINSKGKLNILPFCVWILVLLMAIFISNISSAYAQCTGVTEYNIPAGDGQNRAISLNIDYNEIPSGCGDTGYYLWTSSPNVTPDWNQFTSFTNNITIYPPSNDSWFLWTSSQSCRDDFDLVGGYQCETVTSNEVHPSARIPDPTLIDRTVSSLKWDFVRPTDAVTCVGNCNCLWQVRFDDVTQLDAPDIASFPPGTRGTYEKTGLSSNKRYKISVTGVFSECQAPEGNVGLGPDYYKNWSGSSAYAHDNKYTRVQSATGAMRLGSGATSLVVSALGTINAPDPLPGNAYDNYVRFELHPSSATNCSGTPLADSGWVASTATTINSLQCSTSYKVCVQTRNGDGIAETETGPYGPFDTSACSGADFTVAEYNNTWPDTACVGDQQTFRYVISNSGDQSGGYMYSRLYANSSYVSPEEFYSNLIGVGGDSGTPGTSCSLSTDRALCWTPSSTGNYSVQIKTDSRDGTLTCSDGATGSVSETNETNNCSAVHSVTVSDVPGSAPSSAWHISNTINSVSWMWNSVAGVSSYQIYSSNNGGTYTYLTTVTGTSYTQTVDPSIGGSPALSENTRYWIRVYPTNSCGPAITYAQASAYTSISVPGVPEFGSVTNTTVQVRSSNPPSSYPGQTAIEMEEVALIESSGWQASNTYWTHAGLSCGQSYLYHVRARNGDGEATAYSASVSQSTAACNVAPNTPVNQVPVNGSFINATVPTLVASSFSDPDAGDTHSASQWQVCLDAVCSYDLWDSGTDSPTIYKTIGTTLSDNGTYYWRVRYQDNNNAWSNYSTITSFGVDVTNPSCGTTAYNAPLSSCTNSDVVVTIPCTDPGSGASGCVSSQYTTTRSANGSGNLTLLDRAGNYTSCPYNVTNIDKTNPVISSVTAADMGSCTIQFTVTASDTGTGVCGMASSAYSFDGGSTWKSTNIQEYTASSYTLNAGQVKVRDSAGNITTYNSTISGSSDCNGPAISFNPNGTSGWSNSVTSLSLSVTDSAGVSECRYKWDNPTVGTGDGTICNAGTTSISISNGSHTLYVWAKDGSGNTSSSSSNIYRVDTIAPVINSFVNAAQPGDYPQLTWATSDSGGSNLKYVQIWRAPGSCSSPGTWGDNPSGVSGDITTNVSSGSWIQPTIADGTYCYGLHVDDNAGNTTYEIPAQRVEVVIDTTAPQAPTCSPGTSSFLGSTSPISCTDAEGGVTIRYTTSNTTPNTASTLYTSALTFSDTTTLKVRAWDSYGNASGTNTYEYTELFLPNTTITSYPPSLSNDPSPIFEFTGTNNPTGYECMLDGGSWTSCTSPHGVSVGGGSHTFQVRAINAAGTDSSPASYSWTVDVTNPTCSATTYSPALGTWTKNNVTVTVTCSDASGCQQASYQTTVTSNSSGNVTITDNAGNTTQCPYTVTNIDKTAPTISAVNTSAPACEQMRATVTASDSASGLNASAYSFDGGNTWQIENYRDYYGTSATIASGQIKVRDVAYNEASYGSVVTLSASVCDTSAPTISFTPTSASWTNVDTSSLILSVTDDGTVAECRYKWDNATVGTGDGSICNSGNNTIVWGGLANGSHTLYVWANDTEGNERSANAGPYQIDVAPPSVDSFGLTSGGATPSVNWSVSDSGGSGLAYVQIWRADTTCALAVSGDFNPVSPTITQSGNNSSSAWTDTTVPSDGNYCYGLHVNDHAGNYATESAGQKIDVVVDTTAPPTPTCTPGSTSFLTSINVNCSDSEAGVTIRYTTSGITPSVSDTVYSGTLTFTNGTTLKVRAWDSAGNASGTNTYEYTQGNLPNTSITSNPTNPSADTTPTFGFTGTNSPTGYECRIDAGTWASCTSPYTPTVSAGSHTFDVRAINSFGADESPASYTWIVDTSGPSCSSAVYTPSTCTNTSVTASISCTTSNDPSDCTQSSYTATHSSNYSGTITVSDTLGNTSSCPYNITNIDATGPNFSALTIEGQGVGGSTTITTSGNKPTVVWTVSTSGCSTFSQIELWRAVYDASTCNGSTMSGCSWTEIWVDPVVSSSKDDTTAGNIGDYWYGVHAVDSVGNCTLENNVACGGTGDPVRVTMAIPDPDFTLDLSPTSQSITQGDSITYNLVVNPSNGFSSVITNWSVVNCPGSASCSVAPSSCGLSAYSSCATLSIDSTGGLSGTYSNISVQGTGNGITRTSNVVDLTVSPVAGYSIQLSPSSQSVTQGTTASYNVAIVPTGGFNSTVSSWSVQSCPGGSGNCSLTFSSCASGSYGNCGTLRINTGALSGTYSGFTVSGSGGGIPETSNTASVTVNIATDFSLSLSPSSQSISIGETAQYSLVVNASGGFTSSVGSWFIENCPSGASCSVAPSSCTSGSYGTCATLTITNTAGLSGTYSNIRVQGVGGGLTRTSNTVSLSASAAPDFVIGVTPTSQTIAQGGTANYTVAISPSGGFASSVGSWSVQGCPGGASCSVSPSSCTSGSYGACATLTISNTGALSGSYSGIRVQGIGGGLTRTSNSVTVNINVPVGNPPTASYTYCRPDTIGAPYTVQFTDTSTDDVGLSAWEWDFGDGSALSTAQHPSHTFPSSPAGWWDGNWTRRTELTFDNSAQGSNLDNFPVLVTLDGTTNIDYAQTQNNGEDLRFVDADGVTVLDHEIEEWNEAGLSYVWVRVPRIDAGSTTDSIWMYYGNASASDGQNATGVWDSSFETVNHLAETPADGVQGHYDSTANGNHGTPQNFQDGGGGSTNSAGQISGADDLGGDDDYVDVQNTASTLNVGQAFTLEAWVKRDVTGSAHALLTKRLSDKYAWKLSIQSNNVTRFDISDGSSYQNVQGHTISDTNWHYIVARSDGSSLRLFNNGSIHGNSTSKTYTIAYDAGNLLTGAGVWSNTLSDYMNGRMDEVRVSSVARSNDWIAAQYLSMTDALISDYGTEEFVSVPYTVALTVTDTDAQQDSDVQSLDILTITACTGNQAPSVPSTLSGPVSGYRGVYYPFTANATDPDGDPITYEFDWDDDGITDATDGPVPSGTDGNASGSFDTLGMQCVRARTTDGSDTSAWSACTYIEMVNRNPIMPSNPDPADGTLDHPTIGDLSFDAGDEDGDYDTVTYMVTVYEDGLLFGASPVVKNVAGGTTAITITNAELGGPFAVGKTYTWFVNADDGRGGTQTGPVWTFMSTDACTPSSPDPAGSPAWTCNVDETANITWDWSTGIAGASGYELEIDDTADFSSPVDTQSFGSGTTNYTTSNYPTPDTLYARVRATFSSTLEFEDSFTESGFFGTVELGSHTNIESGSGWTRIISVDNGSEQGTMSLSVVRNGDYVRNGTCGNNDGSLYRTNDMMSSPDYTVSAQYRNQNSGVAYSIIAARIQDANNMYAFEWSSSAGRLWKRVGGTWSQIGSNVSGINEPSIVSLQVSGSTISVYDDGLELLSVTDTSHSSAGYAGIGMGAVITLGADCLSQQLDNFSVGVSSGFCGAQSNWSPTATQPISCGLVADYEYCRPDIAGAPNTVKFFNTSTGGSTPYTFDWDFGDGSLNSTAEHPEHDFSTTIAGQYAFEDGSGSTLTDTSGNGNNGTLINMEDTDWVPGVTGTALRFDGVDEYVEIPHDTSFELADGKIDMWFMLNTLDANQSLLGKDHQTYGPAGGHLNIQFDGDLGTPPAADLIEVRLQEYTGPTVNDGINHVIYSDDTSPLTTGRWYHLEVWFGTGGLRMALDGVMQLDTDAYSGGLENNTEPFVIGVSNLFVPTETFSRPSSATIDTVSIVDTSGGGGGSAPYTVDLTVTDDLGQIENAQYSIDPATVSSCDSTLTSVVGQACTTVGIGWATASGTDEYEIYRSEDSGPYVLIDTIDAQTASGCGTNGCFTCDASVCTYDNNGNVSMLTRYDYYINALRFDGTTLRNSTTNPACDGAINICPLGDSTPSCTPSGVISTSPTCGQIRIDWNNGSGGGVDGYNVYRALNEDGPFTAISASGPEAFEEQSGQVVFEAESYDANIDRSGHSWIDMTSPSGYSGSQFLGASPNSGATYNSSYDTTAPELQYNVNFTNPGTYYVWVRGIAGSGSDDSIHVGIDGTTPSSGYRLTGSYTGAWAWSKSLMSGGYARIDVPDAGVHTVNFWMREDGFGFDKALLTTSSGYTPSGTGPAESGTVTEGALTTTYYTDVEVLSGVDYYYYVTSIVEGVESSPSAIAQGQTFCFRSPSFIER